MTSARDAAARDRTVGQRSIHSCHLGTTREICVCCSITSDTRIAYESRVPRHGSSRPFSRNQSSKAACTKGECRSRSCLGATAGRGLLSFSRPHASTGSLRTTAERHLPVPLLLNGGQAGGPFLDAAVIRVVLFAARCYKGRNGRSVVSLPHRSF